jgi:diguanylate cyclase (GGDEF)-like protein
LRFVVLLVLGILYSMAFLVLQPRFGSSALQFDVVPLVAAGALLGVQAGLRMGLILTLLNIPLNGLLGSWVDGLQTVAPSLASLLPVGVLVGLGRDAALALHERAQEALRLHQIAAVDMAELQYSESALRARERQQAAVADLGQRALAGTELSSLLEKVVYMVPGALSVEYCSVWQAAPDGGIPLLVGGQSPGEAVTAKQVRNVLATRQPLVVDRPLHGLLVLVPGPDRPFGVLSVYSHSPRHFNADDQSFVQAVANVLGTAIQRTWAEDTLARQAMEDALTKLPNRARFHQRLLGALTQAARDATQVAVLYIDLDNFKWINDSLGHAIGDRVLLAAADRLRRTIRTQDVAARLGGDEFAVLLQSRVDVEVATEIARRVIDRMREPLRLSNPEVRVTPSIGIVLSDPDRGPDQAEDLLRHADAAMYQAKAGGKARFAVFEETMDTSATLPLELGARLERAFENEEFVIYYQPIVDLATGRTVEVEALIRWQHPQRGLLLPAQFIPLAEQSGLIVSIGRWVLEGACRQVSSWQRAHPALASLVVSVNLAARHAQEPTLAQEISQVLDDAELDPRSLRLELTETVAIDDHPNVLATLREIARRGVRLAIDDFGTGYASLRYLRRFPADVVKIDRSFVDGMVTDPDDTAIVKSVVALAGALQRETVAEGIETADQLAALRALGCERGQGFYFARPMSAASFERWLLRDEAVDQQSHAA